MPTDPPPMRDRAPSASDAWQAFAGKNSISSAPPGVQRVWLTIGYHVTRVGRWAAKTAAGTIVSAIASALAGGLLTHLAHLLRWLK